MHTLNNISNNLVNLTYRGHEVAQNAAENEEKWGVAADNYSQAKNLSTRLLDEGRMMEAEKVKRFSSLEKKCRTRIKTENQ